MKVIAKATFIHGSRHFNRGDVVDVSAATARDLETARLVMRVEEKKAPEPKNKMASKPKNKSKAKSHDDQTAA